MTESLLSLSTILLFGQRVEDLHIINADPAGATPVDAATTPPPPPVPAQNGNQTVDGINLTPGALNRVLVKDLGNPNANGVYTVAAGAWVRDLTIANRSVVAVGPGGIVNGDTNWLVERRVVGPNTHYRFYDPADRERRRSGLNRQLGEQVSAIDARIAKIYGFSYEGRYYDLARPTLFLVHGDGEVVTQAPPAVGAPPHGSRAPRHPSLTGLSGADFDFADDLRVWSYDKADYSIRMDVETGMLEQLLLEAELDEDAIEAFHSGQRARVSGQRARVSGQRARVSGQRVRRGDRGGD
jgi:hypothetical protein